jgi:hypothetical protein
METKLIQQFIIELDAEDLVRFYELANDFWEYRNKAGLKQSFKIDRKHIEFMETLFNAYRPRDEKGKPIIENLDK